jgi:protein subunit release factor B
MMLIGSDKERRLKVKMERLHVREHDIEEVFTKSSGPGGQNVNKVESCVVLCHRPTGLTVKCQEHRTQFANRFFARELLLEAIENFYHERKRAEKYRAEKLRRQNRKRPQALKEKILELKKKKSARKKERALSKISTWKDEI